jgi:hypothetical protein
MKILMGDFNAKVGREDIFKPIIGNESLHEASNDNGLNVHGVHNIRQKDIHTAQQLVTEPSLVKVEIAIGKLKSYRSLGTDQILAELIKAGDEMLCSEIHKLICSTWNKEELPQQLKESIIIPIHKKVDQLIVIIIEEPPSYQLPTKFYPTFFWAG